MTRRRLVRKRIGGALLAATVLVAAGAGAGVLAVVGAGLAIADPSSPWSAPAVVAGSTRPPGTLPTVGPGILELGFTPAGVGVVSFPAGGVTIPLPPAKPSEDLGTLSAPITADAIGAATQLTPLAVSALVTKGANSVVAALDVAGAHPRPSVAVGPIGGPLGKTVAIGQPGQSIRALASDARGDVAALLESCAGGGGGCSLHHVFVVVRRFGGAFGKPVPLVDKANGMTPRLAIGPTGDVLLAWAAGGQTSSHVFARIRFASGRVGRVQTLGPALDAGTIAPVIGAGDRAMVGWASAVYGIDGAVSPATFRLALAGNGGEFGAAHTLDRWDVPGTSMPAAIDVVTAGGGAGLVAWQGYSGSNFDIDVASFVGVEVFPPELSPPGGDATLDSLAASQFGASVVLWTEAGNLYAGSAAPTEPLAGPELVAEDAGTYGASAAFDPMTGSPLAVWYGPGQQSVGYSVRAPLPPTY